MMILFPILSLVCIVSGSEQETFHGTAFVSGMAELKCNLNIPQDLSGCVIYWQKGLEVVYVMIKGKEDRANIDNKHKNRTMILQPNGDLKMYNITYQDMGQYTCYLLTARENNWKDKKHESLFRLDVFANFSHPEIDTGSLSTLKVEEGEQVTLNCSSGHGFPKPRKMFWKLSDENETHIFQSNNEIKNISMTFNISSSLSWKVQHNINITCVVEENINVSSKVLQIEIIEKPGPTPEPPHSYNINIIIICSAILVATVISSVILLTKTKKCFSRSAQNRGRVEATLNNSPTHEPEGQQLMTLVNETANGS